MNITIYVIAEKLSDGTPVFGVRLGNVTIPTDTINDARDLADKILHAMCEHSMTQVFTVKEL